jgi:hypothetical protein
LADLKNIKQESKIHWKLQEQPIYRIFQNKPVDVSGHGNY